MRSRQPTLRYRCPTDDGPPTPGTILMGDGPRVRRAYRVLGAIKVRSALPMLGFSTWRIAVDPMSAERGLAEIEMGSPRWTIVWDRREKRRA